MSSTAKIFVLLSTHATTSPSTKKQESATYTRIQVSCATMRVLLAVRPTVETLTTLSLKTIRLKRLLYHVNCYAINETDSRFRRSNLLHIYLDNYSK